MSVLISRRSLLRGFSAAASLAVIPVALAGADDLSVAATRKALAGDFMGAGQMAQQSGDPAAVKLVELLFLKDHGGTAGYARIVAFLNGAPKWPLTQTLLKRAEEALYVGQENAATIQQFFATRKALTPFGQLAQARAAKALGDQASALKYLRAAWRNSDVDAGMENRILAEFGSDLSAGDHKQRLWQLIYDQQANGAVRNAKRLGGGYVQAAEAAAALIGVSSAGERKYNALPASLRNEPAMLYVLARFYRKQEKYDRARVILASMPGDPALMGNPEAWFEERRNITRHSVGPTHAKHWKTAYQIARNHGLTSGDFAVDAHFLAGWVALRYIKDPAAALGHFGKLQKTAQSRTELARAAYWTGRSYSALGDKNNAKAAYRDAAQHSTVYYGQLAREQIGLGTRPEDISSGESSSAAQAYVERDEVVRAFRIMAKAGTKNELNMFLWSLANRFNSVDQMNAVANVVQNVAGTSWSVRLAKAAGQRDIDIDSWSYPIHGLPQWRQVGKPVERSLVFALSRQESEFDPNAGSKVGAQGLMQLMPGTAKLVANQYRMPFAVARLKGDPSYNVQLGAAHLADLVDKFGGSYVLTLVAYNAGPRRSREWVDEFGDLRGGQVDPIDWVECIPFHETRQYVQKVLQNVHVYRSRLAPQTVKTMTADLTRGAPSELATASTSPLIETASCEANSIASLVTSCN